MRTSLMLALTLIAAGCAYKPTKVVEVQMTARNDGAVYYGTVQRELLRIVRITVEVDRRIYSGNLEATTPNSTFGLYRLYGARDAAPRSADTLNRTNYTWAILSSTDNLLLKCDFTDYSGRNASGLCVDQLQRVYDVVLNPQQDVVADKQG